MVTNKKTMNIKLHFCGNKDSATKNGCELNTPNIIERISEVEVCIKLLTFKGEVRTELFYAQSRKIFKND